MKETWKMIALLAVAIGGLLAYAFIPEQVAENIPLKQIGMDALTGKIGIDDYRPASCPCACLVRTVFASVG